MASFKNKVKQLKQLGYLDNNKKLTDKGDFASNVFFNELLVSELFCTGLYKELTDVELLVVLANINPPLSYMVYQMPYKATTN